MGWYDGLTIMETKAPRRGLRFQRPARGRINNQYQDKLIGGRKLMNKVQRTDKF